jgi:cation transport ATPase
MGYGQEAHAFETSAVLISFVLLGKIDEFSCRSDGRLTEALTQLNATCQSKTAILVSADGSKATVEVELIHPGDYWVKILRGASLPADGVVCMGELMVDESMMTGESMPILKTPGSLVLGGTVCMESDGASVQSYRRWRQHSPRSNCSVGTGLLQTRQVPIRSLADTISSIFVPTVCTLAVVAFLVWCALCKTGVVPQNGTRTRVMPPFRSCSGTACLVISCPCALGLATPTAVMVSIANIGMNT